MKIRPQNIFASIPKNYIPFLMRELSKDSSRHKIIVAENEADISLIADIMKVINPQLTTLVFPGWDCLPYDRVPPHTDILAQRINCLSYCADYPHAPLIVITTVNAFLQKVPPQALLENRAQKISAGTKLNVDELIKTLRFNNYRRVETVREVGEFALRGGLIDLFLGNHGNPLRIDLFGDEVESIHAFDPFTQRREAPIAEAVVAPMTEVLIGEQERERFKNKYRDLFGPPRNQDELYQGALEGRYPKGIEHWSPLFYESMTTLKEYLNNPILYITPSFSQQCESRFSEIQDYYQARAKAQTEERDIIYNPLPPDELYLNESALLSLLEKTEVFELNPFSLPESEGVINKGVKTLPPLLQKSNFESVKELLKENKKTRTIVCGTTAGSCEKLAKILKGHEIGPLVSYASWEKAIHGPKTMLGLTELPLEKGFMAPDLILISEADLLGDRLQKIPKKRKKTDLFIAEASAINTGDYLVHDYHGIGQYKGLETVIINEAAHDCLTMIYDGGDKLFVPVENLDILTRYGGDSSGAKLDKLGHVAWQTRKAKVKKNLLDLAEYLIKTAASRKFHPTDPILSTTGLYDEFCSRFPYTETDDQEQAIQEVLADLSKGEAMDRLVCGDVGFGKTEVAMRAAFAVASSGKQVAVITPTTLLCRQHFATFKQRFAGFPIKIEMLSRLVASAKIKAVKERLKTGEVQIIIGTHALLAQSIEFANLGLVIVDEEQHFGVNQKEKLKSLKADVHVLTLTATPIPRTLQMSMSGVKEMSVIATPPVDRLAVKTFVLPYDKVIIREALLREHHRGGQSFYVSPRIKDLSELHKRLASLTPELKVVMAHGQMQPKDLEEVMDAFYQGKYDILLATNIIESGIDVSNANTMVIHRSDLFGLSQLYQLRGRIGRSKTRAYAYFTLDHSHTLSKNAERRLEVMQTLDSLGAGFQLASHDLDIRGAGNILGDQQSGHIKEIGVELYQQMLQEAIAEIRARKAKVEVAQATWSPVINIGVPVFIPEEYVGDLSVRLELYRRIARLENEEEIDHFMVELIDRFGKIPAEVKNLMNVIELKCLCKKAQVEKIDVGRKGFSLSFYENKFSHPEALLTYIHQNCARIKLKPNQSLIYLDTFESDNQKIKILKETLQGLLSLKNPRAPL